MRTSPSERARLRGSHIHSHDINSDCSGSHLASVKGLSARTNRAKLRNLLAAAEGADLLKMTQLKVIRGWNSSYLFFWFFCHLYFNKSFLAREGLSACVSKEARYMTGVLLHWSQSKQRTLL